MWILVSIIWYIVGIIGLIYWWTVDDNYTLADILPSLLGGVVGPFTWLIGYSIYRDDALYGIPQ